MSDEEFKIRIKDYSLIELRQCLSGIDHEKYPERHLILQKALAGYQELPQNTRIPTAITGGDYGSNGFERTHLAYRLGKRIAINFIALIAGFLVLSLVVKGLLPQFAGPLCFFSIVGSSIHLALVWIIACVKRKNYLAALPGFIVGPLFGIILANIYFYLHAVMGILNYNPY